MPEHPILYQTEPLERASFDGRPNRFVVAFRRGRQRGHAYLANTGRLGEILLPGTELLLARRPHTRLRREAVGAAWSERWPGDAARTVYLNAARTNGLAERLLQERLIPELADAVVVRKEPACGGCRFDFQLSRRGRPYLLEVKSVTLVEQGLALFPDARTERGKRHLEELARQRPACDAGVLFLVQGDAASFLPDAHNDLEFARAFCASAGRLDILAYSLAPSLTADIRIRFTGPPRRVGVPADLLDRAVSDSGVYLLVMCVPRGTIDVGSLGPRAFRAGWYVYTGSARRGLTQRLERHLRLRKRPFYHVDFLRSASTAAHALPIRGGAPGECELAGEILSISSGCEDGFGCSDCRCRSHLFYFSEPPQRSAAFQEVLTRLRHQALAGNRQPPVRRGAPMAREDDREPVSESPSPPFIER
jgi:sugar fermentation stimulation protein A